MIQVMPGINPRRHEVLVYGLIEDSQIEAMAGFVWQKTTFPNEFAIVAMYSGRDMDDDARDAGAVKPRRSGVDDEGKMMSLLRGILDLAKDSAIYVDLESIMSNVDSYPTKLADYIRQVSYDTDRLVGASDQTVDTSKTRSAGYDALLVNKQRDSSSSSLSLMALYEQFNPAPSVYIAECIGLEPLGPYWYRTPLSEEENPNADSGYEEALTAGCSKLPYIDSTRDGMNGLVTVTNIALEAMPTPCVYFRQRPGRDGEFEWMFSKPLTGTSHGSGTVGGK
jgi:hypothetical protein